MKKIRVVIGANFGDEGKGLMTDYFCEALGEKVLNVRFNATSQAGHTVERDGKRHVFAHFGAGSLYPGVATYLSSFFWFNPVKFYEEFEELNNLGVHPEVYLSNMSEAITIYDIFFNCIIEEARGSERHGSCGAGLWEAVNRVNAGYNMPANYMAMDEEDILKMLLIIRDEYYPKRFADMGVTFDGRSEWYDIWYSDIALDNYIDLLKRMQEDVVITDESRILNEWDYQVYEGAQGLLLDYNNREYMPNLTASYTGSKNVVSLLNKIEDESDVEICYVTRTYFTRHGAGRFETETAKKNLRYELFEQTNVTNRWQGGFRWGYFDEPLFIKTIKKDEAWLENCKCGNIKKSIAFTHANCTDERLILKDRDLEIQEFVKKLPVTYEKYYCVMGKAAKDVVERVS